MVDDAAGRVTTAGPTSPVVTKPIWFGWSTSVEAWLEFQEVTLAWGETLRGNVVFRGGQTPYGIKRPIVANLGYRDQEGGHNLGELSVTQGPITIEPRSTLRLPFDFPILDAAPFQHEVSFDVSIYLGFCSLGHLVQPIKVIPPIACMQIAAQFCEITGMSLNRWEMSAPGRVCVRFAGGGRRALFTDASLDLSPVSGSWRGALNISRRTLWPVRLDRDCLWLPLFPPHPELIREYLLQRLREGGFRPCDTRDLPLPADSGGGAAHELPIPTARRPPSDATSDGSKERAPR